MRSGAAMLIGFAWSGVLAAAEPPGKMLDLAHWKLTLPTAAAGEKHALEIRQPQLATFSELSCFFFDPQLRGVVLRAACGGAVTKGSKFPRCELRELYGSGKDSAAVWSTADPVEHVLEATLAITHLPAHKPQVVCAQIHDAEDDLLMIRLEKRRLFVERNETGDIPLDSNYELGTFFDLKIMAGQGHAKVWYNGAAKLDWEVVRPGCYFKAGCYTQSNVQKGDAPDAYGEVVIRRLEVPPAR